MYELLSQLIIAVMTKRKRLTFKSKYGVRAKLDGHL